MDKYVDNIYNNLKGIIVNPTTELNYATTFELLVAVILSAQCTDKRVNIVTKELFKVANTPQQFANMSQEQLELLIKPCGYYRNKAKNIINCSIQLLDKFDGKVPSSYDDLISLAGVGTKTANVMLAVGFDKPGFAVDTHVQRVSYRLGLTNSKNPNVTEKILKTKFDVDKWGESHHLILLFGRYYCTARNPKCDGCVFRDKCNYKRR